MSNLLIPGFVGMTDRRMELENSQHLPSHKNHP